MKLFTIACLIALTLTACSPAYAGGRSSSGGAPIAPAAAGGAFTASFPGFRTQNLPSSTKTKTPFPAFPGFSGRKQYTESGVKTIVNYENGKVVSVVQVR
jgi:hypothetical protein